MDHLTGRTVTVTHGHRHYPLRLRHCTNARRCQLSKTAMLACSSTALSVFVNRAIVPLDCRLLRETNGATCRSPPVPGELEG